MYVCVCFSQPPQSAAGAAQPLGSRLAWALPISCSPSSALAPLATRPPLGPPVPTARALRPRRDGACDMYKKHRTTRTLLMMCCGGVMA